MHTRYPTLKALPSAFGVAGTSRFVRIAVDKSPSQECAATRSSPTWRPQFMLSKQHWVYPWAAIRVTLLLFRLGRVDPDLLQNFGGARELHFTGRKLVDAQHVGENIRVHFPAQLSRLI